MKIITAEQIKMIGEADRSVAGTNDYVKYQMECYFKGNNNKWKFQMHTIPMVNHDCPVKTVRGAMYIMERPDTRYLMTDEVLELLGWK